MFPQPPSEFAIIDEMKERQRQSEVGPRSPDAYRWFDQAAYFRPNWVRTAMCRLGHWLVFIGHQLENGASNLTTVPPKHLESM